MPSLAAYPGKENNRKAHSRYRYEEASDMDPEMAIVLMVCFISFFAIYAHLLDRRVAVARAHRQYKGGPKCGNVAVGALCPPAETGRPAIFKTLAISGR